MIRDRAGIKTDFGKDNFVILSLLRRKSVLVTRSCVKPTLEYKPFTYLPAVILYQSSDFFSTPRSRLSLSRIESSTQIMGSLINEMSRDLLHRFKKN